MSLNPKTNRYSRVTAIDEIGEAGQARICAGSVLMVGCGALGSAVGLYLAGGGVGHIGICDFDTVAVSNLHRQVAYSQDQAGEPKALCLGERMRALNDTVTVNAHAVRVTADNFSELASGYDIIADCSDNAATKHLISQLCHDAGKICVTGGVHGMTAQVFITRPEGLSYSDFFGDGAAMATPALFGVLGPVAGVAGTLQATAIMQILAGLQPAYTLLTIDTLTARVQRF